MKPTGRTESGYAQTLAPTELTTPMLANNLIRLTQTKRAGAALIGIILLICVANALWYTMWVANPVIRSDAWYFLDAFVSKDLAGTLGWSDYFVKRGSSDHSQPLLKILLSLNTHWFGLDFFYEALAGFIGLIVCCVYLIAVARSTVKGRLEISDACIISIIPLVLFSLNSVEIYEWSLVILFYVVLPLALLLFSVSYRPARGWGLVKIFLVSLTCLVVMDNSGLLVGVVVILALILEAIRGSSWRSTVERILTIVASILLYRWSYAVLIPSFPERPQPGLLETFKVLLTHGGQAWKAVILPAAVSVAHLDTFVSKLGAIGFPLLVALGCAVVLLHVVFWVSVWRTPAGKHATFMAVCLMLFVYCATAGIVVERVPRNGWGYLLQHRYVSVYQLANISFVLQWICARAGSRAHSPSIDLESKTYRVRRLLPVATLLIAIFLQIGLSYRAWQIAPFMRSYERQMAQTLFCLANHPEIEAPICEPLHAACGWHPEVRNRLVSILKDHQLNAFSPDFQRRHGMQPDPATIDRCVSTKPPSLPFVVTEIVDVRVVTDGDSNEKVIVGSIVGTDLRAGDTVVTGDNSTFPTVFGNQKWVTFSLPFSAQDKQQTINVSVLRPSTNERSKVFSVKVKQ